MMKTGQPLVRDVSDIRLAMLGMVAGNGHPYSWSAIFNGFDRVAMQQCPYPAIPGYLNQQPDSAIGIPGARVTHIWTDDPSEAVHVAACSRIPTVVSRPEDVIGQVDAVVVATDIGHEHVRRCRAFIEAGLPVFVDKPLVDNLADLHQFRRWVAEGRPLMSSSCMRYACEFQPYHGDAVAALGKLRLGTITTPKTWERYGIHALEAVYPIFGPGFLTVRNTGTIDRNVVHFTHRSGADLVAVATTDMLGGFGLLTLAGTRGQAQASFRDSFSAFKAQLVAFIEYLRNGTRPFPFDETDELMRMIIGGILSRDRGGAVVDLLAME